MVKWSRDNGTYIEQEPWSKDDIEEALKNGINNSDVTLRQMLQSLESWAYLRGSEDTRRVIYKALGWNWDTDGKK